MIYSYKGSLRLKYPYLWVMSWISKRTLWIDDVFWLAYWINPGSRTDQFWGNYALVSFTMAGRRVYDTFPSKTR